jgi:hypothetical protein
MQAEWREPPPPGAQAHAEARTSLIRVVPVIFGFEDFAIDPLVNAILSKWMNTQQNSCRLNCAKVNRKVR